MTSRVEFTGESLINPLSSSGQDSVVFNIMKIKKLVPKLLKRGFGRLLPSYVRVRTWFILVTLRGNNVECPACGWRGLYFIDDVWHQGTICPKCHSDTRHRLLLASLTHLSEFSVDTLVKHKDILHFAPEPQIGKKIRSLGHRYVTADLERSDVDLKLDISKMTSIESESFHLVIACDVLEHVQQDRAALLELYRVLKKGGTAILTVPQKDYAETTYEDDSITSPQGREKAFGQWDHLRIYGADFVQRVESAGFKVCVVDENSFDKDIVARFVLKPPKLSRYPLATNYRKVFFCRK